MSKSKKLKYFNNLENRARHKLVKRYNKPLSYHDKKMINDILYNEKTHYVEGFKEYLIYEDYNEFLKRFYKSKELNIKLPKILFFYEKYSKIYPNYTVIPESKYMYKNIKRKQKMIDQMQNNKNKNRGFDYEEEDEDSIEDVSNTVFSSRIMNSICRRTLTTINKSDNDGNSEKSINDFLDKINNIENRINNEFPKNNFFKNWNKYNKNQKEMFLHINKLKKDFMTEKQTPKTTKVSANKNGKNLDIHFTYSKKNIFKNNINRKKINNENDSNINNNNIINNKNTNSNNLNNPNLLFINSYIHKKNNGIMSNNNSIGNTNNNNTNNTITQHIKKNSMNPNLQKPKLPTALFKQSLINSLNNINNFKENTTTNKINDYFTNATHNLNQKPKISLGEALLKNDKIILSTNTSTSPRIINEQAFSSSIGNKTNNLINNNQNIIKDKENKKEKNKEYQNQPFSNNKFMNSKKIKYNLLDIYNNKFFENQKLKKINKVNKLKKTKINQIQNKELNNNYVVDKGINSDANIVSDNHPNIYSKKPQSHRNYYNSKILSSGNVSNTNNETSRQININNNNLSKKFILTDKLKNDIKNKSQKVMSSPSSMNNSSTNFYFQSSLRKNKNNNEKIITKTSEDKNSKRIIHNYNVINNIYDNSTQINIYTGNDFYKPFIYQNNSAFNNSNLTPAVTYYKSPLGVDEEDNNKKKVRKGLLANNTSCLKSHLNLKEKKDRYKINFGKIISEQALEEDKPIISDRHVTQNKLLEKLGKYFFKKKKHNSNLVESNINSNTNINSSKRQNNKNDILYNNHKSSKNIGNNDEKINNSIYKNINLYKVLKYNTNNNTPNKNKYNILINTNNRKLKNLYLSPK